MKFSVSMYSYMQKIRSGEATPFELIAKTKELGFDAIEFVDFTDFGTGTKEERLAHAEELRKECERVGLEISALVMSCDFITGSDGDLDKEIARVKDYVDIAHVLGVTRMRHDAAIGYARNSGDFCPFDTMLPRLAKACKEITEYAAQFGIRTMVENHGFYVQDSERVRSSTQRSTTRTSASSPIWATSSAQMRTRLPHLQELRRMRTMSMQRTSS